jgi:tetratricopeptide (TPR) repeat protein
MKHFISLLLILPSFIFADAISDSYVLEYKKEYTKAYDILEPASKEDANDYFLQLRMGWLALLKGDYTKSSSFYQKATLIYPNAIEPRIGYVRALLALGQYKQVEVACKTILKIDSKNYFARSNLAYTYYVLSNYSEAEKIYDSIVDDYPADTEMMIGLGWSLLKQNKKPKANDIFKVLLKIIPKEERVSSGAYYATH